MTNLNKYQNKINTYPILKLQLKTFSDWSSSRTRDFYKIETIL